MIIFITLSIVYIQSMGLISSKLSQVKHKRLQSNDESRMCFKKMTPNHDPYH